MRPTAWITHLLVAVAGSRTTNTLHAQTPVGLPNSNKRYYDNHVSLDQDNHHREFISFVSRPDLDAPRWKIETFNPNNLAPGYWFVAPYASAQQHLPESPWTAPHIYDGNGDLVWSGAPVFGGGAAFDFRLINVQGKPTLSAIDPHSNSVLTLDETYRYRRVVELGESGILDEQPGMNVHEFNTVDNGNRALHLTTIEKHASQELSASIGYNGECFVMIDGVRELDTRTWDIINEWTTEGHIGFNESYARDDDVQGQCENEGPWDFMHTNSVDKFPNGDYLISSRQTYAIYRISAVTGAVVWRLGGLASDFKQSFKFSAQHDAKIYESNDTHVTLSFLDNAIRPGDPQPTHPYSRGLIVQLDTVAMTAKVLVEVPHPEESYTAYRGGMQILPNGNIFMGWSFYGLQSEHQPDGFLLMKARFEAGVGTYRAYKHEWIGRPYYPPDVHAAVVRKNDQWYTVVHASWNGATEVREWRVYYTDESESFRKLAAQFNKTGFESSAWTGGYASHVVVEALDKEGHTLGTSKVFRSLPPFGHSQPESETGSLQADRSQQTIPNSSGKLKIMLTVEDPSSTFLHGVLFGVLVTVLAWFARRLVLLPRPTWRFPRWSQTKIDYKAFSDGLKEV